MCGIAGFCGPWDISRLKKMSDLMSHRGPDGEGQHLIKVSDGSFLGFAHRRLSIIDLESGAQPMIDSETGTALVFNGEIYNFQKIRAELEKAGQIFRTHSDTEVILRGYMAWGEKIVEKIEGMFAFAVWHPATQTLFCARDPFGIKPFYYCLPQNGTFAFASEIKPLNTFFDGVVPDQLALANYLHYGWNHDVNTIFKGVKQLPPAHTLKWKNGRIEKISRFWALPENTASYRNIDDCAAKLASDFEAAVDSHLIADVPVGLTLSGGLDSSAVIACMIRHMPVENLEAFTVGYGLSDDELPFARKMAEHVHVSLKEEINDINSFAPEFSKIIYSLEEPIAHPVLGTTFFLSRFVNRMKKKVILIGEGSDELFAGYPEYKLFGFPFSFAPNFMKRRGFFDVCCLMPDVKTLASFTNPDLVSKEAFRESAHTFDHYFKKDGITPQNALKFELENELVYNQLMRIDKLMMAHSVEARVPFLDKTFGETAFSVPFEYKIKGSVHKYVFRKAMKSYLPEAIISRPKSGKKGTQALLPSIFRMLKTGPLSDLISEESIKRRGWFDAPKVLNYIKDSSNPLVSRHPVESRKRLKFTLALSVLEQWARLYIDKK